MYKLLETYVYNTEHIYILISMVRKKTLMNFFDVITAILKNMLKTMFAIVTKKQEIVLWFTKKDII